MPSFTRRDFLHLSAFGTGVVISTGLAGCSDADDDGGVPGADDASPAPRASFDHGVASGDPQTDGIILWTRVTAEADSPVPVRWEVASDPDFTDLTNDGSTETDASRDWTVKVDARNLAPGSVYHYRFLAGDRASPAGTFRTLPEGPVESLRLAVVSCSNYPYGRFHVYREIAGLGDVDAVVHLGDYIYEYGAGTYPTAEEVAPGRALPAGTDAELLDLDDYRARYALYRTDPDLQAAHASAPFIVVWDDHEVANDAWRDGAQNHQADEGDFEARKLAALRAWFEWMPVRPVADGDAETIYRRFDFGDLVSLHMLDTRQLARDEQLDYANYIDPASGTFNAAEFAAAVTDPNRTLLGPEQLGWLEGGMADSAARWQVLGQQVLMGRMLIPAELLLSIGDAAASSSAIAELVPIKLRIAQGDPSVTDVERARVGNVAPYNLDAWDGYAAERERVLGTAAALDRDLVVLAGDTHNGWANRLRTADGTDVGVEFATPAVTSPGIASFLGADTPEAIRRAEGALTALIDDLAYTNLGERGLLLVDFAPDEATGRWVYVDGIADETYAVVESRGQAFAVRAGAGGRTLVERS